MRHKRFALLMLFAFSLSAPAVWSADGPVSGRSVCVLPLVNLTSGAAQQDYQEPFSRAVEQEFQSVGFALVPREQWAPLAARISAQPERIVDAPQAIQISRGAGADMAVAGFYRVDEDRVLVSVQCYDVTAGILITGFSRTWRFNLGFYNFLRAEIADLVQKVAFSSAPKLIGLKESVRVDEISFTVPQDGMEVLVEGQRSLGRIQEGVLVFQTGGVNAGTLLRIEKRQDGYHTVWQTVRAKPQIVLDPIPRKSVLSLEVDWTTGELVGAGVTLRWYPVPDWLYLGVSEYLFTQVPVVASATWPIHADTGLLVGLYLLWPPEAPFRMGVGAGAGAFLTSLPGSGLPLYTDVYINLLTLWLEWRVGSVKVFSRAELKVPLGIGRNLLGTTPITWNAALPPLTFGVVIPWQ